jgi:hypothetical protein
MQESKKARKKESKKGRKEKEISISTKYPRLRLEAETSQYDTTVLLRLL